MRTQLIAAMAASVLVILYAPSSAPSDAGIEFRSLDGGGNNVVNVHWGQAGTDYARVAKPAYADSIGAMQGGPSARYVSNRIFNDVGHNVFSENAVSQMGWLWGQFVDHTLDLRVGTAGDPAGIPFLAAPLDQLEGFKSSFSTIDFSRTPADPLTGTSTSNPRQQINTVNSFIDAWNVYGGTASRLDWTRAGTRDGNQTNNAPSLLLPGGYLPYATQRNDVSTAPAMDLMGPLTGHPESAIVAGDVRANENSGLTAIQTLFAREHNRIVGLLDASPLTSGFSNQMKFDIARRVVGAEQQYITYNEFLPAMGVDLSPYTGYRSDVNPTISNEFATVGFRAHSQIHGEMEPTAPLGTYTAADMAWFASHGITQVVDSTQIHLSVPLSFTFGNPSLVQRLGVGPLLKGLAAEKQYKNDEQFDNQLRSVLFQIPSSPTATCLDVPDPACFSVVSDLAAIDVARARDHGIPLYNALRAAYGLPVKTSFTDLTGETSDVFPAGTGIDTLSSLDFTQLRDLAGNVIPTASVEDGVAALRKSPLAARLKAIYGSVDNVDAFVGMVAEQHAPGSELGQLQQAIWKKQFELLRDGDRFFYANDTYLQTVVAGTYGIDYERTLAQVIQDNTDATVQPNVFKAPLEPGADSVGLVAAYGFDAGTGTKVSDSSGRGNDGTTTNTAWAVGKYGGGLLFNGTSSLVTIPGAGSLDLTAGMTLEAWVRPTVLGSTFRTVLFKEMKSGMEYSLYANDDSGHPAGLSQMDGEHSVAGLATVSTAVWTHLAVTYDGAVQTLYVNGVPVASTAAQGAIEVSNGVLRIGGNPLWGEWFTGRIDEVRIYNRALPQALIQVDMATPVSAFPGSQPIGPAVVGEQHVQTDSNPPHATGIAEAYPATASVSGVVEYVHVYADSATTAEALIAGVYSDRNGHPDRLLAAGSLDTPLPDAWNSVAVPAVRLAAGTTYWIAMLGGGDGVLGYRDRCCSSAGGAVPTETAADRSLTGLPDVWTTGSVYGDGPISAYAGR